MSALHALESTDEMTLDTFGMLSSSRIETMITTTTISSKVKPFVFILTSLIDTDCLHRHEQDLIDKNDDGTDKDISKKLDR